VRVGRLILRPGGDVVDIGLDHPMLAEGWWEPELGPSGPCRWTNGDAALVPMGFGLVEVRLAGRHRYPVGPSAAQQPAPASQSPELQKRLYLFSSS
jgi:hypothetical protein